MNRILVAAFVLSLGVCGLVFADQEKTTSMWNEAAAGAARTVVEQGLAAVERLDPEGLRALFTDDIVAFDIDIDLEGKPVRMGSPDAAVAYVAGISDEAKKMGAKVKFENVDYNCRATADLGYCILGYSFVTTMADGTRMVQPSQTTVVLARVDGAWKWAHWHTSLSALPTPAGQR